MSALAIATRTVADATAGNSFRCIARQGELLASPDETWIYARQRRERSFDVRIVGGYVVDIIRRERAGDRRHNGVGSHA